MAEVTWLGDEDPSVQSIEQYGHTMVKGVPTNIPDKDPRFGKFKDNAFFHVKGDDKGKPEPVESKEPDAPDPDAGTELAAARLAVEQAGLKWHHKSSVESLRKQLAEAQAALPRQKAEGTAQ